VDVEYVKYGGGRSIAKGFMRDQGWTNENEGTRTEEEDKRKVGGSDPRLGGLIVEGGGRTERTIAEWSSA
jgi:hypothetical protein